MSKTSSTFEDGFAVGINEDHDHAAELLSLRALAAAVGEMRGSTRLRMNVAEPVTVAGTAYEAVRLAHEAWASGFRQSGTVNGKTER